MEVAPQPIRGQILLDLEMPHLGTVRQHLDRLGLRVAMVGDEGWKDSLGSTVLAITNAKGLDHIQETFENLSRNHFFDPIVWVVEDDSEAFSTEVAPNADDWFSLPSQDQRLERRLSRLQRTEVRRGQDRQSHMDLEIKISQLKRDLQLLERQNEELFSFTSTIAHDLNHPLNTIISYVSLVSELVQEGQVCSGDVSKMIDRVKRSASRLGQMIKDLLVNARYQEDEKVLSIQLDEVIAEVVSDLENLASKRQARITVGPLPKVLGNKSQLYQVFLNLISNAIKFSKEDEPPLVEIHASPVERDDEGEVKIYRITVQDNGVGIAKEDFDKLFRPFSRLKEGEHIEGSGLGLATVKKIVGLHAGSIKVESQVGEWTRFTISLPVNLSDQAIPFFRKELRYDTSSEKVLWSKVYRKDNTSYLLKVVNESEKGFCCRCTGEHGLSVGDFLELEHRKRYMIRWIKDETSDTCLIGLKLVE